MKKILLTIILFFGLAQMMGAIGTLSSVYVNPVSGSDSNVGSQIYPVQTWDKALQLAADNATIYVTWAAISITTNTTIDGSLYGATNITVMPNTGYTGALFAVAGGVTGTFSNITLKGTGLPQGVIIANSGGALSIGSNLHITDGGQITLDGNAMPINLNAPPPSGMKYELLTTYSVTDEGRTIVNAGTVSNPLQHFTLIEPTSTTNVSYELEVIGTTIRLYERAIAGIYLDPINGNDTYSGAKSNHPVKTLERAIALWNERNIVVPDIKIFILSSIILTKDLTLDDGVIFTRFNGDSDRSTGMKDFLFVYSNFNLTINNATIDDATTYSRGVLYSEANGTLTLNNGATITANNGNINHIIESRSKSAIIMNAGATITKINSSFALNGFVILSTSGSHLTINGGTITTGGNGIYNQSGTIIIHDVTINQTGGFTCIYNSSGSTTIHNATITTQSTHGGIYNDNGSLIINGGHFTSESTSPNHRTIYARYGSDLIINGATIDGGQSTAIYKESGYSKIILNATTISSTNTTTGAVHSKTSIHLNGENVNISGSIYLETNKLESHYININSSTVTQDYTLKISPGTPYAALVKSDPNIDLGLYENKFTLDSIENYQLMAYTAKGQNHNDLVLYNPNGIYVNDYNGVDTNTGTSPASPVKTLANAASKTTATKTTIFICDSTLAINMPQNISHPTIKNMITSFMFNTHNTSLIRITTGGSLTLENITIHTPSDYARNYIQIEDGALTLNKGTTLMTNGKYGIYQTGGNVIMNDSSLIIYDSIHLSSRDGYGIYQAGKTATATINSKAIIQNQKYGIYVAGTGTVNIKDSAIIQNNQQALYLTGNGTINVDGAKIQNNVKSNTAIYATNGTINLNGTIIRNNGYYTISIQGQNTVINMTAGKIINNGTQGTETTTYQGTIRILKQATFNMSGGLIAENNIPQETKNWIFGEQVYITAGGKMNFTGGHIAASKAERNAIYVQAESTIQAERTSRLTLGNAAMLDSGFIYCSNSYFAPISLNEPLNPTKTFNINLGDNMAGCIMVDGTSPGTFPASITNFVLNPNVNTLSLAQSGDNVVVGSTAIYLNGTSGSDINDGSSAALAVKTFKRARERLLATNGDYIIIINAARLSNVDEIDTWDLSFNPNAVVQRGLGYTGNLVYIQEGESLTVSDITFDGDKENNGSSNYLIYNYGGTLTINAGTIIRNNANTGVYNVRGSVYMNGGMITNNGSYGIAHNCEHDRPGTFIMTGGSITENARSGMYNVYLKNMRLTGGEISRNGEDGIKSQNFHDSGVYEMSGTFKMNENALSGFHYDNNSTSPVDSFIISGAEICNNSRYGIFIVADHVSITGGRICNNGHTGITLNSSYWQNPNSSFSMIGGTISDNGGNSYYSGISINGFKDVIIKNATIHSNDRGFLILNCTNTFIENSVFSNNRESGLEISGNSSINQGSLTMINGIIHNNNSYGVFINTNYSSFDISGNVQITNNKNSGICTRSQMTSSISGNVLFKDNKALYGGGIYIDEGIVNISDSVTFEADTCTSRGGAIYVNSNGEAIISGNVKIKNCVNSSTYSDASYGGSAISSNGRLSMTDGSITGCVSEHSHGTVHVTGNKSNVNLTRVKISDNTAQYGSAVYVYNNGKITLDSDTIINNTSTDESLTNPVTGNIHIQGGTNGRVFLRDKNVIDGRIYIHTIFDRIYVDEALMTVATGAYHLLGNNFVTNPGTIVVSPNGTTVTDASQFLQKFTLVNQNIGRGLDKGGPDEKHIIVVNQFFIDGTKPDTGNGANPSTAFNNLTQLTATILQPYTTVWVSGPVTVTGSQSIPTAVSSRNNVNLRRYTGFAVAAQEFPAYDSVLITIEPEATLTIPGGNSATNRFTISGEGGSSLTDASIFKNNGTLNIGGHTRLYFNPTAGNANAIYQNGTLNLSGNVEFELYGTNTVYLPEGKVIHINGLLNSTLPIGITVETSPTDTHYPGRIVATGTTTNIPVGMESHFYNELASPNLPIGRVTSGTTANLIFYLADRNVTDVPIYTTLQDAFDASVSANNDEVRLYGKTEEAVIVDKTLRYNSQGFNVAGSFTLDSTAMVQLLDDLATDTLFIRANTFGKKTQLDRNGKNVTIAKAAYLDLRLPPNPVVGDWYPFNLPFEATVTEIQNVADTTQSLLPMQHFALAAYDGQRRANDGIGNQPSNPDNDWQYFSGTKLDQGTGYMVTTKGIEALRFKAADLNLFATVTAPITYYMGTAGAMHQGINYVAQPIGINSTITGGIANGSIVQVSENFSSDRIGAASYVPKTVSGSLVIAPYTNYFYQTAANRTVAYTKSTADAIVRSGQSEGQSSKTVAQLNSDSEQIYGLSEQTIGQTNDAGEQPVISAEVPSYYEIRLFNEDPSQYDALFVAAGPYALKDRYEIGRDVVKMGSIGQTMQLWSTDFDMALCANEATLEDKKADFPLFIHTPGERKEYTLKLQNVVSYSEQLWLCRNGKMIQNLTECPEFTLEGTGHTLTEYSLRLLTGTTDNSFIENEVSVYTERGVIVIAGMQPEQEYAVFDMNGRLFAQGKAKSDRIRITANKGSFVVKINEITHKVVVK